jgi:hypothetical protein
MLHHIDGTKVMGKEDPFDEVYKKEAPKLKDTKEGEVQIVTGRVGDIL